MVWVPIEHERPTKSDVQRLLAAVRFYVDHDVDAVVPEMLRWLKHDVETAKDVSAEAHDDQWHYKRAFRTKRVLIAKDKGYLDNDSFPLSQTRGIIILNIDTASAREAARALEAIHFVLAHLRPTLDQTKVILNADYTMTFISRVASRQGFAIRRSRYRVRPDGVDRWESRE